MKFRKKITSLHKARHFSLGNYLNYLALLGVCVFLWGSLKTFPLGIKVFQCQRVRLVLDPGSGGFARLRRHFFGAFHLWTPRSGSLDGGFQAKTINQKKQRIVLLHNLAFWRTCIRRTINPFSQMFQKPDFFQVSGKVLDW